MNVNQKNRGPDSRLRKRPCRRWPAAFAFACAAVVLFLPCPARAVFHEQIAIDTKAISLANTVTADPPGHMSIHYNPAGLSNLPDGKYFSQGLTVPFITKTSSFSSDPDFEGFMGGFNDDPLDGTEGTSTSGRMYIPILDQTVDFLVSPTFGLSYRKPGSRWTFAVGNYAPFAVGMVHGDDDDPSRFGGQAVYQQHLVYLAPAASYKVSDTLVIGGAVTFGQTAMGLGMDMRSPNELVALTRVLGEATEGLEIPVLSELTLPPPWFGGGVSPYDQVANLELDLRNDFTPSFNLGVLWSPLDWLTLGACYQSGAKADLGGSYKFSYTDTWQRMVDWLGSSPLLLQTAGMLDLPTRSVDEQSGRVTTEVEFPQRVQLGIKVKPLKRLSLMADLYWSEWSVMNEDRIQFDQDIQLLKLVKVLGYTGGNNTLILKRNFEDTWTWSVGMEYEATDRLTLRCGYERRQTSVQDELFDLTYALPDMDFYGAGFGLKFAHGVVLDVGFGYLVNESYTVKNNGSTNMNSTEPNIPVYNPYAGLDYEQETVAYMGSAKVSMPLETMMENLHHTMAILTNPLEHLNPFRKKPARKKTHEPEPDSGKKHVAELNGAMGPRGSHSSEEVGLKEDVNDAAFGGGAVAAPGIAHETGSFAAYRLTLSEFSSRKRAEMALSFYEICGLSVHLCRPDPVSGNDAWAICMGPFPSAKAAERAREENFLSEAVVAALSAPVAPSVPATLSVPVAPSVPVARSEVPADSRPSEGSRISGDDCGWSLKLAMFRSRERAQMALTLYENGDEFPSSVRLVPDDGKRSWSIHSGCFGAAEMAEEVRMNYGLAEASVVRCPGAGNGEKKLPPAKFTLKLAEFSSAQRAEMALSLYESAGLPLRLASVSADGVKRWILYAGAFGSRRAAEQARVDHDLPETTIEKLR